MRLILNSRAYSLASATTPGNERDSKFYSHYYARRLPAEVLADAYAGAAGVPTAYAGYPLGMRAVQVADPGVTSYFLSLFGRSERVTACACERQGEVTLPQLLHLKNSDDLQQKIGAGEGRLADLLKQGNDAQVVRDLFLATLSREPGPGETAAIAGTMASGSREEVFRDLFWALLNSKEFTFNH